MREGGGAGGKAGGRRGAEAGGSAARLFSLSPLALRLGGFAVERLPRSPLPPLLSPLLLPPLVPPFLLSSLLPHLLLSPARVGDGWGGCGVSTRKEMRLNPTWSSPLLRADGGRQNTSSSPLRPPAAPPPTPLQAIRADRPQLHSPQRAARIVPPPERTMKQRLGRRGEGMGGGEMLPMLTHHLRTYMTRGMLSCPSTSLSPPRPHSPFPRPRLPSLPSPLPFLLLTPLSFPSFALALSLSTTPASPTASSPRVDLCLRPPRPPPSPSPSSPPLRSPHPCSPVSLSASSHAFL